MSFLTTRTWALFVAGFGAVLMIVIDDVSPVVGAVVTVFGLVWCWRQRVRPGVIVGVLVVVAGTLMALREAGILPGAFGGMFAMAAAIIGATVDRTATPAVADS